MSEKKVIKVIPQFPKAHGDDKLLLLSDQQTKPQIYSVFVVALKD